MKKLFLVLSILLLATNSYAGSYYKPKKIVINKTTNNYNTTNVTNVTNETTNVTNIDGSKKNVYGAKLDAPKLIQLNENWYIGVEGAKDLYNTNVNEGWTTYGKVTYIGTWFSFKKN